MLEICCDRRHSAAAHTFTITTTIAHAATISLEKPLTTRFWQAAPAPIGKFPVTRATAEPTGEVKMDVGPPVLVVDLTDLSNGTLHNRFDKFACNDPEAKAALSKQIAADFDSYLTNAELLQRGVVHVRCSHSVRSSLMPLTW